ncbi:protein FAM171B isoform X2 [Denticeps clupeoides]|uniref:Protein FAM171B n=1 Tax=Denticeps clupeoides TaxID=299321 RepID=A0AAY4AZM1_9TELE|nr:protein FAM171B isoform X2 [Denticeps clupeoides]
MADLASFTLLTVLLMRFEDGRVSGAEAGGPALLMEGGEDAAAVREPLLPEPPLVLRVWVKDKRSQRYIRGAVVQVFVNGTRTHSTQTQDNGEALLMVPFALGETVMLLANMDGYLPAQLPWKTRRMPIFSSVTVLLLPQTQGNIWLFEDTVLITRKTSASDFTSQPCVQFPRGLLELPVSTNVSMLTAYLTTPQLPIDCHLCTTGLASGRSGNRSVTLKPVAALSVQLLANGDELPVSGSIKLTVPLLHSSHLLPSESVPAWAFDKEKGTWLNKGVGTIKMDGTRLVWTYVASHLGNWIAAPLPSVNGYVGTSVDIISYHTYLLLGILAGSLFIVIGFLSVLSCHCRDATRNAEKKRQRKTSRAVLHKDQTTSTRCDHDEEASYHPEDRSFPLARQGPSQDGFVSPRHQASYNMEDVGHPTAKLYENICAMHPESMKTSFPLVYVHSEEMARIRELSDQKKVYQDSSENVIFPDKLFHIYNQSVAIIQTPEHPQSDSFSCQSATFPRNSAEYGAQSKRQYKDSFTQTLPKIPVQDSHEQPSLETRINPGVWGRYSHLLESVSVPGTLNEAVRIGPFRGELQGISEQTLLELSKAKPSPHPPRAWFVSLDGKPLAQVRHSVIDLQGRHRPGSSNDTSLDSGVDMNEHQQPLLKGNREGPSLSAIAKTGGTMELDHSSSEVGSPEDVSMRNTSSLTTTSISEEPDASESLSELQAMPPPQWPHKVREKIRADKRNERHACEKKARVKR